MSATITATLTKLLEPLRRRVRLMVARAVIELVDDSKKVQSLQLKVRADELRDDVERMQQYGFTSVPEPGAEAIIVLVGGNSDHPVAIAVDDRRYRPTDLAEGEVALWTLADGKRVWCRDDGMVDLGDDGDTLGDNDRLAQSKKTKDEISALRDTVNSLVTSFNSHIHPSGMGPTGTPPSPASSPAAVGDVHVTKVRAK